jgi:hypothetical protein
LLSKINDNNVEILQLNEKYVSEQSAKHEESLKFANELKIDLKQKMHDYNLNAEEKAKQANNLIQAKAAVIEKVIFYINNNN